jgi:hypothetical protein
MYQARQARIGSAKSGARNGSRFSLPASLPLCLTISSTTLFRGAPYSDEGIPRGRPRETHAAYVPLGDAESARVVWGAACRSLAEPDYA